MRFQVAMQTTTRYVFHHKDHVLLSVNHLIELDNMLIIHLFHQLDFAFDGLAAIRIHQLVFLVDFHRYFTIGWLMQAYSHHSVGTLPDLLANYVVIHRGLTTEKHRIVRVLLINLSSLNLLFNLVGGGIHRWRCHSLALGALALARSVQFYRVGERGWLRCHLNGGVHDDRLTEAAMVCDCRVGVILFFDEGWLQLNFSWWRWRTLIFPLLLNLVIIVQLLQKLFLLVHVLAVLSQAAGRFFQTFTRCFVDASESLSSLITRPTRLYILFLRLFLNKVTSFNMGLLLSYCLLRLLNQI